MARTGSPTLAQRAGYTIDLASWLGIIWLIDKYKAIATNFTIAQKTDSR